MLNELVSSYIRFTLLNELQQNLNDSSSKYGDHYQHHTVKLDSQNLNNLLDLT